MVRAEVAVDPIRCSKLLIADYDIQEDIPDTKTEVLTIPT
jgi:hypothetical protein